MLSPVVVMRVLFVSNYIRIYINCVFVCSGQLYIVVLWDVILQCDGSMGYHSVYISP